MLNAECRGYGKAGDVLEYDVCLHPKNPDTKGGVDIELENGNLRDSGAKDQNGITAHGTVDWP